MKEVDPNKLKVGKRIEAAMNDKQLDAAGIARRLQISHQAVQQWIQGGTTPRGNRLLELAEILGSSAEWLLTGNKYQQQAAMDEIPAEAFEAITICEEQQDCPDSPNEVCKVADSSLSEVMPTCPDIEGLPIDSDAFAAMCPSEPNTSVDKFHPEAGLDAPIKEVTSQNEATVNVDGDNFLFLMADDSMVNPTGFPSLPAGVTITIDPKRQPKNNDIVFARLEPDAQVVLRRFLSDSSLHFLEPLNPEYPAIYVDENCRICGVAVRVEFDL